MLSVKTYEMDRLRNTTVHKFFSRVEELIKSIYGTETCDLAVNFLEASQAFELALKGCDETDAAALEEADDQADDAWGSLQAQIMASLRHPNPEKKAAAASVYMIFAEFSNPTRLNYDEEYELIQNQVQALRTLPKKTLDLAYVTEYIDALEKCRTDFLELLSRSSGDESRRSARIKKARKEAMTAYQQFTETLNVMLRIRSDGEYVRLAEGLNALIGG